MDPLVEARNLHKSFGRRTAVAGVSFEVFRGTVVAFLGPNGAGKSTTLRLLAGCLAPDRGTAVVAGHDTVRASLSARASLGYLPETASGFFHLTVDEFLAFAAESRGLWAGARRSAIERAMTAVDLQGAAERKLGSLSKGLRQRAFLAQAILHDPPVLILDEPSDGLDPNQKAHLRRFIRSIAAEKAVLMSTHILEEAEAVCDRAIVIAGGRVVADAPRHALADAQGRFGASFERLTGGPPDPARSC